MFLPSIPLALAVYMIIGGLISIVSLYSDKHIKELLDKLDETPIPPGWVYPVVSLAYVLTMFFWLPTLVYAIVKGSDEWRKRGKK